MTVAFLGISDARYEQHQLAYQSALEHLPKFDQYVFVSDPGYTKGFAGAIKEGWEQITCDYVFHFEADFIFKAPVDVGRMIELLERRPHLVQVALKRQAVNEAESDAGGVVEVNPASFMQSADGRAVWTEHNVFFTTNPSVYPRWVLDRGWPQKARSEGRFAIALFDEDPARRSCYWGDKYGEPLVEHIGERAGVGY